MTVTAMKKLVDSGNMALLLAAEIYDLVKQSDASRLDVVFALNIVKTLIASEEQTERSKTFEKFFRSTDSSGTLPAGG